MLGEMSDSARSGHAPAGPIRLRRDRVGTRELHHHVACGPFLRSRYEPPGVVEAAGGWRPSGFGGRGHRRSLRMPLIIDQLETRTMLSVSAIMGPMPSHAAAAPATLNLQLQPGSVGALSPLMPGSRPRARPSRRRRSPGSTRCRAPPRTWASSPRSSRPTRPSSTPARSRRSRSRPCPTTRTTPTAPVAAQRHLGHQCPRGLERHHRLEPGDRRRH